MCNLVVIIFGMTIFYSIDLTRIISRFAKKENKGTEWWD
uniref:Uncharacterized protein n=1 Tax=Candidatus Methanophagaceae archaeon ANME-1 ERB6 TaxID=2759912 RepID=A0A7G9Z019_9EURY|nr:hypothetical protein NGENPBHE_00003 [Methanosarcinales archaeon ANME-1 ERB6]